jgi:parallel beta-helix repeat protein
MNRTIERALLFLILALLLGETSVLPFNIQTAKAAGFPAMSLINPGPSTYPSRWNASSTVRGFNTGNFTFYSNETARYSTFFANVTISDITSMIGWEIGIVYDNTTLQFVDAWLPSDNVFNQSGSELIYTTPSIDWYDATHQEVMLGCAFAPLAGWSFNGTGTLCQLEFKITTAVSSSTPQSSSPLTFDPYWTEVYYVPVGGIVPHDVPTMNTGDFLYQYVRIRSEYSWAMFHGDMGHTGYSESPAPGTNQTQWNFTAGAAVSSSPAVANGIVYVGSDDANVYALDQYTGAQIWKFQTGGKVRSSPAVAGGRVYVGSFDHKVYCLDAYTGIQIWNYTTGLRVFSSPVVAGGAVYVGSEDNETYCLNAFTGTLIWNYTTDDWVVSSPAVDDGRVYVGSMDSKVYCLDASTGTLIWNYTTDDWVESSPAVDDGRVYVGSMDSKVYCLDASTGIQIWSYAIGGGLNYTIIGGVFSSPAVAGGAVYVGSEDNETYCLNASTGTLIWNYTTGNWVDSSPAVADGKVFFVSCDGTIYCLDSSTGHLVWSYMTGVEEWCSPAVSDGVLYVSSVDHRVYAFGNVIQSENYPTVQAAINAASSGATVWVAPGTYSESLVIDKPLTIIGKRGSSTKFSGGGVGINITVTASGTRVIGVVITSWDEGILIQGASGCEIYNDTMSQMRSSGIVLEGASGTLIYSNVISQSEVGINLTDSSSNVIYHNSFIGNVIPLSISASSTGNIWDDGYPSGGNYWSGYKVPDYFSGPFQNLTGSDGIGDTARVIDANNIDRYPLMIPSEYKLNPIPGDVNRDARVTMDDIMLVVHAFGSKIGQPRYCTDCDIDDNLRVDMTDIMIVVNHFGQHYP